MCKCKSEYACRGARCSCAKAGIACQPGSDCSCAGFCRNPNQSQVQAPSSTSVVDALADELKVLAVEDGHSSSGSSNYPSSSQVPDRLDIGMQELGTWKNNEPEGGASECPAQLGGEIEGNATQNEKKTTGLKLQDNCWYELTLSEAVGDVFVSQRRLKWPSAPPLKHGPLHELLGERSWTEWSAIRSSILIRKLNVCDCDHLVRGRFLQYVPSKPELAFVYIAIDNAEQYFKDLNSATDPKNFRFINIVKVESLRQLSNDQVWSGCTFLCGGNHEERHACPIKVQTISNTIKQNNKLLSEGLIKRLDPVMYCAFGGCRDLSHSCSSKSDDRCHLMRSNQEQYLQAVRSCIAFEQNAERQVVKVLSWNTLRLTCALQVATAVKGFTAVEKRANVGFSNARRAFFAEEKQLFELLRDRLRGEVNTIRPDVVVLQEIPYDVDAKICLDLLGLSETNFSFAAYKQPRKLRTSRTVETDAVDPVSSNTAAASELRGATEGDEDGDIDVANNAEDDDFVYEQHVFIWNKNTMRMSKRPQDFLFHAGVELKHASPTMGLTHIATGKLFFVTSIHLQCGGVVDSSTRAYKAAMEEFAILVQAYRNTVKPVTHANIDWSLQFEQRRVCSGDHIHILAGDFNLNPHRLPSSFLPPELNWLCTGSEFTVTNAGREERGYDFFLVDRTAQRQASFVQSVLRSSVGKSAGNIGLSDHDPILLTAIFHEKFSNGKTFRTGVALNEAEIE